MPVVKDDWHDPSGWAAVQVSWGVIRDGEALRFARSARGAPLEIDTVSLNDWRAGCAVRSRVEEDLKKRGRLVAGLPPSRVMLRTLHSPLADARKSAEIWPSLLDAALPFPLESCLVAFGKGQSMKEGGRSCLAAAIRIEDLQAECEAWQSLGLDPECMVPEALMISEALPGVYVWAGHSRSVFVHWTDAGFSACGGAKDPSRDGKTLSRFLSALEEAPSPKWVGPAGEEDVEILERGLASVGLGQGAVGLNLRAEPLAHPGLLLRAQRTKKVLMALAAVLLAFAVGMPLVLRARVNHTLDLVQRRMSEAYHEVTGEVSPGGQERLWMERWIDQEWGAVRAAADRVFVSGVSAGMREVLTVGSRLGVTVRSWRQDGNDLRITFQSDRGEAEQMATELGHFGWRGELVRDADAVWTYVGGKE